MDSGPLALLAAEIQNRCLDWLGQPIQRVHGGEASPSISRPLEAAACAGQPISSMACARS
jgi:pyruvate/2-oxoglutarate/acetoin dehydrogenase E1 component